MGECPWAVKQSNRVAKLPDWVGACIVGEVDLFLTASFVFGDPCGLLCNGKCLGGLSALLSVAFTRGLSPVLLVWQALDSAQSGWHAAVALYE